MIKLIAYLGNPGKDYEKTRHNAGYMLFDELYGYEQTQSKFHSLYLKKGSVHMIKPITYMNLSGTAVSEAASFFRIRPEEILVVHDDLELPLGEVKLQKGGGLQGHNGLRSIRERIGSAEFHRLRIGIGRPKYGDVRVYVTSSFTDDERITLSQAFVKAERLMKSI